MIKTPFVRDEIAGLCRLIIAEHFRYAPAGVSDDSSLISADLETDSLDSISITMACEHEFEIEITDNEAAKTTNVGELINLVVQKLTSVRNRNSAD